MTMISREKPARIEILDALRGISILLMVLYHFGYDLVFYQFIPAVILYNPVVDFLQVFFASIFILLSGISARFSKNNAKRGAKMLLCAALITVITYFFDPTAYVRFGILHFLGAAALIYALLNKVRPRFSVSPVIFFPLFIASYILLNRPYNIGGLWMFGIYRPDFISTDYFPLFPWIFLYLSGPWIAERILEHKFPDWFYRVKIPFFPEIGRHTLWVYLLHQPVLMIVIQILLRFAH